MEKFSDFFFLLLTQIKNAHRLSNTNKQTFDFF